MNWTIFMYLTIGFGAGVGVATIVFMAWAYEAMKGGRF